MATKNGVFYSNISGINLRTNTTTRLSIANNGSIQFNEDYSFPTSDGSANTVLLTNGSGSLSFSTIPNASLDNSSITINGASVSLGGSINVGDITGVSAGNGLTGGGTSGSVTLNVGAGTGISVAADSVSIDYDGTNNFIDSATNLEGTSIAAGDTIVYHDATDNNVKKGFVSDLPFSNNSGTVTGNGSSGRVAYWNANSNITSDAGLTFNGGTNALDVSGAVTWSGGGSTESNTAYDNMVTGLSDSGTSTKTITITQQDGGTLTTSFSIPQGDITNVIAGTGLSGGGTSGSVTLNVGAGSLIDVAADTISVDLSELTTSVSDGDGDFFAVIDSSNVQRKLTKANIKLSGFNNDAGFTTNDGTVTSVAISGTDGIDVDSGSPITTNGTITLGLSNVPNSSLTNSSIDIAGSDISLGGQITGDDIISDVSAGQITNSQLVNSSITINGSPISLGGTVTVGDITNITAGTGLSGGGASGSVTVSLDYTGTDNFIDSATNLEGTGIGLSDTIVYHDASDNNVKKGLVSDLPYTNTSGTVTSVAISGSDGIDIDSGSPITSSGTIALGLSNVPNSSLANSSITINGTPTSLGGSITVGDITNVTAGTGLSGGGTSGSITVNVDYLGTDNIILAAGAYPNDIEDTDYILVSDSDNNAKKALIAALPYTNSQGTVTSVAISGSDGIDVDSGSPITTNGTIALGLSNVPNSSLANSSITVTGGNGLTGGGSASLGGSVSLNVGAGTLIDVDGSNVNVDLSELTTSTSNGDGDFFVVVDSSNNQKKLTKANISNSGFNNDAGYITSAGNTNIYSIDGTLSALRTITQGSNNLDFASSANESLNIFKSISTPLNVPRVFIEADDAYSDVLSLLSSAPTVAIATGYDSNQAPVFRVDGQGNLTATSKAFDIPHPNNEKEAQGMRLKHGNLEGPEHGVYIRGRQLNDKEIELPEYWLDLVDPDTITVQLTSIGSHQNLYVKKIENNVVHIGNGNLFSNKIDCYYFIQAERKDIDKIEVEYITK